MAAFAGESQANRKYLAFAAVADKEGMPRWPSSSAPLPAAETIHAHAHLKNAGHIGTTEENLKAAIEGETYDFTKMYPEMIKDAEAEGNTAVAKYFDFATRWKKCTPTCTRRRLPIPRVWPLPITMSAASVATPTKAPATPAPCAAAALRLSSRWTTPAA